MAAFRFAIARDGIETSARHRIVRSGAPGAASVDGMGRPRVGLPEPKGAVTSSMKRSHR